ncbi:MAG: T9SS type A sorting domain-containing protein [Rhodothermales bacterium]
MNPWNSIRLLATSKRRLTGSLIALLLSTALPLSALAQEKPNDPVHNDLLSLLEEFETFIEHNPASEFKASNTLLRIRDGSFVLIDATASTNADSLLADLQALGLENGAAFGLMVSGWLPISAIRDLANLASLNHVLPSYMGTNTGINSNSGEIPERFELDQNYPNPFNPRTVIPFGVPVSSRVRLTVYNLLGRHMDTLLDEAVSPGRHEVTWDAEDHPSGIYLVRMQAGTVAVTRSLTLMK